jgi:hypothetical protein
VLETTAFSSGPNKAATNCNAWELHHHGRQEAGFHGMSNEGVHWNIRLDYRSTILVVNRQDVVEGAHIHDGIAVKVCMTGTVGAAVVHSERLLKLIEVLYM